MTKTNEKSQKKDTQTQNEHLFDTQRQNGHRAWQSNHVFKSVENYMMFHNNKTELVNLHDCENLRYNFKKNASTITSTKIHFEASLLFWFQKQQLFHFEFKQPVKVAD